VQSFVSQWKNKQKIEKGQNTMPIHIPVQYNDQTQIVAVRVK